MELPTPEAGVALLQESCLSGRWLGISSVHLPGLFSVWSCVLILCWILGQSWMMTMVTLRAEY